MGLRDDDEELFLSHSGGDAFKNPEQRRKEAREQKARSRGKLLDLRKLLLRRQMEEGQDTDAAEADAETKRIRKLREEEEERSEAFGTKTHIQMEEEETMDAQEELSAEELQKMERERGEQKKQAGEEYAGEEA